MKADSMTPVERLQAAIRLEKTDRVPVVPYMTGEPIAALSGFSNAEISRDSALYCRAALKVFDDFGGWDGWVGGPFTPDQIQASGIFPLKIKVPGRELPDNYMYQIHEEEVMQFEDYEKLCDLGYLPFYYQDYLWRITKMTPEQVNQEVENLALHTLQFQSDLTARGVGYMSVMYSLHPFFMLSLMRSMTCFTEDIYYHPETVERALTVLTEEMIPRLATLVKASGVDCIQLVEERASTFMYPLRVFERFWMPYTQKIVEGFWSQGIVTYFHLDTPWDRNLEYFINLPRGSCIVGLDSTSNIQHAIEVLSGHCAIYGDVSAALLSIGSPEDVRNYVKNILEKASRTGGFILGTGCSAPPEIKPENFKAFLDAGKSFGF